MAAIVELDGLRIGALLNTSSGSCDADAHEALKAGLAERGLQAVRSWCGAGADVERALAEAKAEQLDLLVVLGGDGTIRAAAEMCDAEGPLLMPLPGGTMNMLPKALYGARSWREALRDTLSDPVVQVVHGGAVAGRRFFIAALLGSPTRIAGAREAVREGKLREAVEKGVEALKGAREESLRYRFGDVSGEAETVAVLCPLTSRALSADEQVLEAAAISAPDAGAAIRLAWNSAFRDWRADPAVIREKLRQVAVSSRSTIPALLDGESFELPPSVTLEVTPAAFRALCPAGAVEQAA